MLQFVDDWPAGAGPAVFESFAWFVGSDAYSIEDLRADLDRFGFLLGGDDGEYLLDAKMP
jgi:hypothetical protein